MNIDDLIATRYQSKITADKHITNILAQHATLVDLLLEFVSQDQHCYTSAAWKLLQALPINSKKLDVIEEYKNGKTKWSDALDIKEKQKLYYTIRIIEQINSQYFKSNKQPT